MLNSENEILKYCTFMMRYRNDLLPKKNKATEEALWGVLMQGVYAHVNPVCQMLLRSRNGMFVTQGVDEVVTMTTSVILLVCRERSLHVPEGPSELISFMHDVMKHVCLPYLRFFIEHNFLDDDEDEEGSKRKSSNGDGDGETNRTAMPDGPLSAEQIASVHNMIKCIVRDHPSDFVAATYDLRVKKGVLDMMVDKTMNYVRSFAEKASKEVSKVVEMTQNGTQKIVYGQMETLVKAMENEEAWAVFAVFLLSLTIDMSKSSMEMGMGLHFVYLDVNEIIEHMVEPIVRQWLGDHLKVSEFRP